MRVQVCVLMAEAPFGEYEVAHRLMQFKVTCSRRKEGSEVNDNGFM